MIPQLHRPVPHDLNNTNPFGEPSPDYTALGYHGHPGVDFLSPKGTPVECCDDGVVITGGPAGTAGNMVDVLHSWGRTRYLHLSRVDVGAMQHVARGQVLGLSGGVPGDPGAGLSSGAHLHFDLYPNGEPRDNGYGGRVDPEPFLAQETVPVSIESPIPAIPEESHMTSQERDAIRLTIQALASRGALADEVLHVYEGKGWATDSASAELRAFCEENRHRLAVAVGDEVD